MVSGRVPTTHTIRGFATGVECTGYNGGMATRGSLLERMPAKPRSFVSLGLAIFLLLGATTYQGRPSSTLSDAILFLVGGTALVALVGTAAILMKARDWMLLPITVYWVVAMGLVVAKGLGPFPIHGIAFAAMAAAVGVVCMFDFTNATSELLERYLSRP